MNVGGNTYSTAMGYVGTKAIYQALESHLKCNQGANHVHFTASI